VTAAAPRVWEICFSKVMERVVRADLGSVFPFWASPKAQRFGATFKIKRHIKEVGLTLRNGSLSQQLNSKYHA